MVRVVSVCGGVWRVGVVGAIVVVMHVVVRLGFVGGCPIHFSPIHTTGRANLKNKIENKTKNKLKTVFLNIEQLLTHVLKQ